MLGNVGDSHPLLAPIWHPCQFIYSNQRTEWLIGLWLKQLTYLACNRPLSPSPSLVKNFCWLPLRFVPSM